MSSTPLLDRSQSPALADTSRRQLLVGAGAATLAAAFSPAFAAEKSKAKEADESHSGLTEIAQHCVGTGQSCLNHCFDLFKTGDTTLAQCAVEVTNTIAACNALAQLSASKSPHLKTFAASCKGICEDCEKECRKYSKHTICLKMADACAETVAAIKKII